MIVSIVRDAFALPEPRETTWEELVSSLSAFRELPVSSKATKQIPGWVPASFQPGARRKGHAVEAVTCGVLDLDHIPETQWEELQRQIESEKLAAHVYTTWSHPYEPYGYLRLRAVFPLSRPVDGRDWKLTHAALMRRFRVVSADPKCSDPNRLYFGPYVPAGTLDRAWSKTWIGEPLDPGTLTLPTAPVPGVPIVLAREKLERLASRWKRSRDDSRQYLGEVLGRILAGEAFAEPGNRDQTIFGLCRDLIREFPNADTQPLSLYFAQSLELMSQQAPDCPTVDDVKAKLDRAKEELTAEIGAVEKYSPDELREIQRIVGTERLGKIWIIQKHRSFWLLGPQGYEGPFSDADAPIAALTTLAKSPDVQLHKYSASGYRRIPWSDVVAASGSVALEIRSSYVDKATRYDPETRTLLRSTGQPKPCEPAFSRACDTFIRALQLDHGTVLERWLSHLLDFSQPLAALLLTGRAGCGKSFFHTALSNIWDTAAVPLFDIFQPYCPQLEHMPLIVGDEGFPVNQRGFVDTKAIRELVAQTRRTLRQKYVTESTIYGCSRMVVCGNNQHILAENREHLTSADVEAINERFVHLHVTDPDLTLRVIHHFGGDNIIREMPAYVAYLQGRYQREGRFGVRYGNTLQLARLQTRSGRRPELCEVLCAYVADPALYDRQRKGLIRWYQGQLLVNIKGLRDLWSLYLPSDRTSPALQTLSQALTGISLDQPICVRTNGRPIWYRIIRLDLLKAWAADTGFADPDSIKEPQQTPTTTTAPS